MHDITTNHKMSDNNCEIFLVDAGAEMCDRDTVTEMETFAEDHEEEVMMPARKSRTSSMIHNVEFVTINPEHWEDQEDTQSVSSSSSR